MATKVEKRFEAPLKEGIMDAEKKFLNFDALNIEVQNWPLNDDEKRMIRNGEALQLSKEQREFYEEYILETRRLLLVAGISREQIALWENDPEGRDPWAIYAATEVGKAEISLRMKMTFEEFRRHCKYHPDNIEDVPF